MATFERGWLESVPSPPPRDAVDDPGYQAGIERLAARDQLELEPVWY